MRTRPSRTTITERLPKGLPKGLPRAVVDCYGPAKAGVARYGRVGARALADGISRGRIPPDEPDPTTWFSPKPAIPISVEQFARRAAARAAEGQLPVLEVARGEHTYRRLFDADRYQSVASTGGRFFDGLPVETGRFGVVLCAGVVDQTAEPCEVLSELNRALGQTGRLYLSTPLVVSPTRSRLTPGQETTRLGLNYLLQASGFELEDLQAVEETADYAVVARKAQPSSRAIATRGRLSPIR
ncbi:MAG: hypothetical protein GY724_20575 [Actinomycetia bacterium]|nr:hypothetical protein [Actinomycetes bacterium]MCP4224073.1 hypothetical protein [Actinomycetes bacterium]MCP5032839.1 hypothetical protein [Actinomycetes bacterium]